MAGAVIGAPEPWGAKPLDLAPLAVPAPVIDGDDDLAAAWGATRLGLGSGHFWSHLNARRMVRDREAALARAFQAAVRRA